MSYQVGSLSALLKGGSEAAPVEEKAELKGLFQSRATPESKKVQEEPEESKQSSNGDSEGKPKAKKGKKKKGKKEKAAGGAEEEGEFTSPSRGFLVKAEASKDKKFDPERETRTVFVGNLPATVNVKDIKRKFKEYGLVETVRLRGAARPDLKTTKKVAVITRKIHENRNNINAYVRFKDKESALKSCQLNGTEFDSHVLRVDMAMKDGATSKPMTNGSSTAQHHDQSKSIFLGNLHFGIEEDKVRKHFQACGEIIDVRLIRDSFTGIGKGFGYVNFKNSDSIELGLKMNGSQLDGRDVRVSRSTNKPKQKIVQMVKPGVKPTFVSKGGKPAAPKTAGGGLKNTKKFIKKPKVEFQGKVGMTSKEIREKKKAVKKAKRAESRKLKAQNKPANK